MGWAEGRCPCVGHGHTSPPLAGSWVLCGVGGLGPTVSDGHHLPVALNSLFDKLGRAILKGGPGHRALVRSPLALVGPGGEQQTSEVKRNLLFPGNRKGENLIFFQGSLVSCTSGFSSHCNYCIIIFHLTHLWTFRWKGVASPGFLSRRRWLVRPEFPRGGPHRRDQPARPCGSSRGDASLQPGALESVVVAGTVEGGLRALSGSWVSAHSGHGHSLASLALAPPFSLLSVKTRHLPPSPAVSKTPRCSQARFSLWKLCASPWSSSLRQSHPMDQLPICRPLLGVRLPLLCPGPDSRGATHPPCQPAPAILTWCLGFFFSI